MTADSIWIDGLILICQVYGLLPNRTNSAFIQSIHFLLPFISFTIHCFIFNSFLFFVFAIITFSTSSSWIIHWVIHNLGEAARDLHSSLCHWVLFGGIFNNCLIYQIDWELGAWAPCAAVRDMSDYGKIGCQVRTCSRRLHMAALGTYYSPLATSVLHFRIDTCWNTAWS